MKYSKELPAMQGRWLAGLVVVLSALAAQGAKAQTQAEHDYPEPRFPRFVAEPDESHLLGAARSAVRQTEGYATLGLAEPGTTVHVFLDYTQDPEVWNAVKQAWAERGVTAVGVPGNEVVQMTPEAFKARAEANLLTGQDGWMEWGLFDPIYMPFLPKDVQKDIGQPLTTRWKADLEEAYGDRPEVKHLFVGEGGGGRRLLQHGEKFLGNWVYTTKSDLLSKDSQYPSDVWALVDEEIVRPMAHVEEGRIDDPEGTHLHWVMDVRQSREWDSMQGLGNHSPGHLNLYPPPLLATWDKGVIRAHGNHTAFYPTMTVHLSEHGKVTSVEGGGKNGDIFRYLLELPAFRDAQFPSAPENGYWYLSTDGMGTNPKTVRNYDKLSEGHTEKANLMERRRAGIQHFSFASPIGAQDMGGGGGTPADIAYAKERGLPLSHSAHMHVYFPTIQWKLRDTGEWLTQVDKGWVTKFDNPEVRALAARYGDPDVILSYDWIPAIPGVNVDGDYEEFASDPWAYINATWKRIKSGAYEYYVEDYDMFAGDE
jgi:hypothetical protein